MIDNDVPPLGVGQAEEVKISGEEFTAATVPQELKDASTGKVNPDAVTSQKCPDMLQAEAFDNIAEAAAKGVPLEEYLKNKNLDNNTKARILAFNQHRIDQLRRMEKLPPMKKFQRTFGVVADEEIADFM